MQDLPVALLFAASLLFLVVLISSALVAEHTGARIPKALAYGSGSRRSTRRSLIVTLPWVALILGGGQLIVVLMLVHPGSTIGVRLVAAVELVAIAAWLWYLRRRVSRET